MSKTYKVVYRRDAHTISDRTVLGCAKTLQEAAVRNKTKSYRNQGGYKKPYRRDEREWRLNYEEGCKTLSHMWVYPRL